MNHLIQQACLILILSMFHFFALAGNGNIGSVTVEDLTPSQLSKYQYAIVLIDAQNGKIELDKIAAHYPADKQTLANYPSMKAKWLSDYPEEYLLMNYQTKVLIKNAPVREVIDTAVSYLLILDSCLLSL